METVTTKRAIYLRPDRINELVDPFGKLGTEAKAAIIGVPTGTLWRLMIRNGRAGERAIVAIIDGMAPIAERFGQSPPTFDDLFEIRRDAEKSEVALP